MSRLWACPALALGLVACSSSPTAPSLPTATPSDTVTSVRHPLLGPPPTNCPTAEPLTSLDNAFGSALGMPPVWAVGFDSESGHVLLRVVDAIHGRSGQHGLYRKVLWVTQPGYPQRIHLGGRSLSGGQPLWFQFGNDEPTTSPVLDPAHPGVPGSGDANGTPQNRYPNFPSYLFIPGSGCYVVEAHWPGGGYSVAFAAGG